MARLTGPYIGFTGDSTRRTTTQEFPLGTRAIAENGKEYTYVKAGAAIAAKEAVNFQLSALGFDDVRKSAAAVDKFVLGLADTAFSSGDYGWVLTRGVGVTLLGSGVAAGDLLSTSGAAAGTLIKCANTAVGNRPLVCLVAESSGEGTVYFG